jgi:hypothetical protein
MSAVSTTQQVARLTNHRGMYLGAGISCLLNMGASVALFYATDGASEGVIWLRAICVTAGLSVAVGTLLQLHRSWRPFGVGIICGAILGQGLPFLLLLILLMVTVGS